MEDIDKLIPLVALLSLGAFLLFLLIRASRASAEREERAPAPVVLINVGTVISPKEEMPMPSPAVPSALAVGMPSKKRKLTVARTAADTPIEGVVKLLGDKNALPMAFLLREILGPPRSRR